MSALLPYLRLLGHYWWRLLAGAVLTFATTAAAVGLLALSGWFITATAVSASVLGAGAVAAFDVYVPGAGIRFFALARTVSRYFERLHNHDTVLRLLAVLRRDVYAGLTRLDAATLGRLRSAEVLNRLTADIDALDELYLRGLLPPIIAVLAVLALAAGLLLIDPALGLLAAGVLLGGLLAAGLISWSRAARSSRETVESISALRVQVLDLVQGLAEYVAFGALGRQRRRIAACDDALAIRVRRTERAAALGEAGMECAVQAGVVAVLVAGLVLHHQGLINGAVAVLAAFALFGTGELLVGLPGAFARIGRSGAAATRVNGLTGLHSVVASPESPRSPSGTGALAFQGVAYRYNPAAPWLFHELDLRIDEGEVVALTGRSGVGKSTLAALAVRLADPEAGRVTYAGVDLRDMDPVILRRRVGYLTQHTELFDDSVAWNLRIANPEAGTGALWRALEVAGLSDMVAALPAGLDTPVGESGVTFSGGQARRLALARVVLADPDLVVLDEPLRGLDGITAAWVADSLRGWLSARTAMLLAHDAAALPPVDRILALDGTGALRPSIAARRTARDNPAARL